ncbi:MAG: hypothetical protein ACT4P6_09660 [Gemmatimonadaceae bacterium]
MPDRSGRLDENALLDLDQEGRICAITIEQASERTGIPAFTYEQIAASQRASQSRPETAPQRLTLEV